MIFLDFSEPTITVQSDKVLDPLARLLTCGSASTTSSVTYLPDQGSPVSVHEVAAATSSGDLGGVSLRVCEYDLHEQGDYRVVSAFRSSRQAREVRFRLVLNPSDNGILLRLVVEPSNSIAPWIIDDEIVRYQPGVRWEHTFSLNLEVNERLGTIATPDKDRKTAWDRLSEEEDEA